MPVQSSEDEHSSVSISIITCINGVPHMIVAVRGDNLPTCPGTLVTFGGSVDQADASLFDAAKRECLEEAGINVDAISVSHAFGPKKCMHFIACMDTCPRVHGPNADHEWEIASRTTAHNFFRNPIPLSHDSRGRENIWAVPVRELLENRPIWDKSLIKPICQELRCNRELNQFIFK